MTRANKDSTSEIRRPLGHQVMFGIGGFLALLVAVTVMAIALVLNLNHRQSTLSEGHEAYVAAVQSAALQAKAIANDQRGFLLSGDQKFVVEADGRVGAVRQSFNAAAEAAATASERQAIAKARDGFERWITALDQEVTTYSAGDHRAAIASSLGVERELRKSYEESLSAADTIGSDALRTEDHSVAAAAARTVRLLLAGLAVALVIGIGIGEWLLRTIVRPLFRLADVLYR
jgi:methyl-accepting chemotaxis protein